MSAEHLASIRRFIFGNYGSCERADHLQPIMLSPAELVNLLEKLQGRYNAPRALPKDKTVLIGSIIGIMDMLDFSEMSFEITLPQDSDPSQGRISILSPLGASMFGREEGETFTIFCGNRMNRFRIRSIGHRP